MAYALKDGKEVLLAGEQGGADQPREVEYHARNYGLSSRRRRRSRGVDHQRAEGWPPGTVELPVRILSLEPLHKTDSPRRVQTHVQNA